MATLRSVAVAGPGPQTRLYRLSLASTFTRPSPAASRYLRTSAPGYAYKKAKISKRNNNGHPRNAQPTTPKHQAAVASHADASKHGAAKFDDVILLGPPPDYPIHNNVDRLLAALQNSSLGSALEEWSLIWDLRCVSRLSSADFEAISSSIRNILFGNNYPHLGRMALYQPAQLGHLKNMSIEAGLRGYGTGLYALTLKLIGCGRPKDVVDIFDKYKLGMREFQGKNHEDLFSWDRERRLSARLEDMVDGQAGLKEMMMVNIAAHTLVNTLDENVLFSMLDSQIDFRPTTTFDFRSIEHAFRACKSSHLFKQFRQNIDKLVLALMCYHPNALVARLTSLGMSRQYDNLNKLYGRVLEASIGAEAFLRPKDLGDFSVVFRNIPLPPSIWLQFMKTFEWASDIDAIVKMLDHDLPQRGLTPNGHFLSLAMLYMAIIAKRRELPPSKRSTARSLVDVYWRRLSAQNWHVEDGPFSRRIRTLSILSGMEPNLRSEITRLFEAAKDGHLGKIGPKTRAAFLEFFMRMSPTNTALQKALHVFKVFPYDVENEGSGMDMAYAVFIRLLALGQWTIQEKLRAYKAVTKSFVATGFPLKTHLLGPLLSIQLQVLDVPMETIVDMTLDATITAKHPAPGIQRWAKVLYGLLTKWTHTSSPSLLESQAGLLILKKATQSELYGVTRFREVGLLMSFLVPIAKATLLNAEQRQELIDMALDIFPGGKENVSINMWMDIIGHSFNRPDKAGYAEGWRRWKEMRSIRSVPAIWWSKMLEMVNQHKKREWALDLVRDAWSSDEIPRTDGFWLRAKSYGLTSELGIDEALDDEQAAYLGRQVDERENGKKKRAKDFIASEGVFVEGRARYMPRHSLGGVSEDEIMEEEAEENDDQDGNEDEEGEWESEEDIEGERV
ncbi:uncharacterized protein I303_107017 [Kwoniella dejecticola CBS 10117]|uniref:Uncharacterized protein n=1 Tax=Kwoniella dejecticola CBS 10117 TaxID=1296121 RepID=A0A1A5ZYH1_9TREE|nr:uncharacterized protein I303_06418 [Kwoniella dejecticola CBS 10117]OBR82861.1 hypothetical protein I303_06418 [Kwoniella dejecticola CBS 10117]